MNTNDYIPANAFTTQRFGLVIVSLFVGFVLSSICYLVTTVSAAPTGTEVARQALSSSYTTSESIISHCNAIIESSKGLQGEVHAAAEGLKGE